MNSVATCGSVRPVRPIHPVLVACILQINRQSASGLDPKVLHILDQATKRPNVMPLRLWQSVTNIGQILEDDHVTPMFNGFCDDLGSDGVEGLFSPCFFSLPEPKQGVVSGLRPLLLHFTTPFLKFTTPVIVPITIPESSGGGDSETVHTEVDTEDCLMPGIRRNLCVFVTLVLAIILPRGDMEVELVGCFVVLQCACTELKILRQHVLFVGCWTVTV